MSVSEDGLCTNFDGKKTIEAEKTLKHTGTQLMGGKKTSEKLKGLEFGGK